MRKLFAFLTAVALCAPRPAPAAEAVPFLVIETGVHEAPINAMASLGNGGLVTVSDDKTARVWRMGGAAPVQVIRPPLGPGDDGALYAVAASARVIAVAGRIPAAQGGYGVAFYATDDFRPLAVIPKLASSVLAMRISPDGHYLAVGLEVGGLLVFDLKTQKLALEEARFPGKVTAVDFDSTGRLAVAADDNVIRMFDGELRALPNIAMPAGARAWSIAFSPDGTRLAAGDRAKPVVHLLDLRSGRFERDLTGAPGKEGGFTVAAFSHDGGAVYAGGSYIDMASGMLNVRRWPVAGGTAVDIPVARDLVTGLMPDATGVLFTTAEPVLGVIDAANRARALQTPRHINFHDRTRTAIRLSPSGAGIEIARAGAKPVLYDASTRTFQNDPAAGRGYTPPLTTGFGIAVTNWRDSRTPKITGHDVRLEIGETARSAAVSPAGAVLGTDFFVRFFGKDGRGWKVAAGSPVWAVHASADGRLVVACFGDGTIHWYDTVSGRELGAVFIDPARQQLVQWTPSGYFTHDQRDDGRADGRSLIGYRINQTLGRASDFIAVGQLYNDWFRPDLVGQSFRDDDTARLRVSGQEARAQKIGDLLRGGLPPRVTVLEACVVDDPDASGCANGHPVPVRGIGAAQTTEVVVSCEDGRAAGTRGIGAAGAAPVTGSTLLVRYKIEYRDGAANGRVVPRLNDAVLDGRVTIETTEGRNRVERAVIPLGAGVNLVRLSPMTGDGAIEGSCESNPEIRLVRKVEARDTAAPDPTAAEGRGRLFALTVGVGALADPSWELKNPVHDATALADILRQDQGRLFAAAEATALTDATATRESIKAALRAIADKAMPDDVVVVFLAGHGLTVDGKYYFAPSDMGRHDPALLAALRAAKGEEETKRAVDALFRGEGLGQDDILPLIQRIKATRIAFILDTCYSATVADADAMLRNDVNTMITNKIGHASGRFVLSGSFTEALDSAGGGDATIADDGHGLFTSFLLKALKGAAGTDDMGRIDIYKLAVFTKDKVMARSRQMHEDAKKRGQKSLEVQQPAFFFAGNEFFALRKLPGR